MVSIEEKCYLFGTSERKNQFLNNYKKNVSKDEYSLPHRTRNSGVLEDPPSLLEIRRELEKPLDDPYVRVNGYN